VGTRENFVRRQGAGKKGGSRAHASSILGGRGEGGEVALSTEGRYAESSSRAVRIKVKKEWKRTGSVDAMLLIWGGGRKKRAPFLVRWGLHLLFGRGGEGDRGDSFISSPGLERGEK